MEQILNFLPFIAITVVIVLLTVYILSLRRIVPTNVVHIVQRGNSTKSYGVGYDSNVYYKWPTWLPYLGVVVRVLPVSNWDIDLQNYSAYDKDRVPFKLDAKAFFYISDTNKAAQKVESFEELRSQLTNVVQGAIRSILAKSKLEDIMEERPKYGKEFTDSVLEDLKSWGVTPIKNFELMDIRDAENSKVIKQIMDKRMSGIETESRVEVAKNMQLAEQAELQAEQEVAVKRAETQRISGEAQYKSQQAIEIAKVESIKQSGIAKQEADAEVAKKQKLAEIEKMELLKVNQIKTEEIQKEKDIITFEKEKAKTEIQAEAQSFQIKTIAEAKLEESKRLAESARIEGEANAEVIALKGKAEAESKKLDQLASVTAQTELAKEIGENEGYQTYLIKLREVEKDQVVGIEQYRSLATALAKAELKLLVNSGDVNSGLSKITDVFTSKGGSQFNGMFEALKQTNEGKQILEIFERFKPKQ